jgi:hypothetical protein
MHHINHPFVFIHNSIQMSSTNFLRTYPLDQEHETIKERAVHHLGDYLEDSELISFDDQEKCVNFTSERLIPTATKNRPRVMLLFSNPHPYSVQQGMFLSPNSRGQENLFWPVMYDAGWLPIPKEDRTPDNLREICLNVDYDGPFEFIFYCYYAFPTNYPEEIRKIFGKEYFERVIEPEAINEFKKTVKDNRVDAVVTFNKGVFNLVAKDRVDSYIDRLQAGEFIHSQIDGIETNVPIFLTYPTGWRYRKDYLQLRKTNLDVIRKAIYRRVRT